MNSNRNDARESDTQPDCDSSAHKLATSEYAIVSDVVRRRQTWKVIADPAHPVAIPESIRQECDAMLHQALVDSQWAPFHYDRNYEGIPEPWRCHVLPTETCRRLAGELGTLIQDLNPNNKLAGMLSACGALVLVTWLPQFDEDTAKEKQREVNEEHLAAASAMTQNLLLLLTAQKLGTYWGSGTLLRQPAVWKHLGLSPDERLIAAVFVDYLPEAGPDQGIVERIPGKNRSRRSPAEKLIHVH